jgi:hypothetical protein
MPIPRLPFARGPWAHALFVAGLLAVSGCGGGGGDLTVPGGGGGGGGGSATGKLSCLQPDGTYAQCDLVLGQSAGFSIALTRDSCDAHGNALILTAPKADTLAVDGCYTPYPKTWSYPGPYPAGTAITFKIISPPLPNPPGIHATGTYPAWDIVIEDGGDANFRDIFLSVTSP